MKRVLFLVTLLGFAFGAQAQSGGRYTMVRSVIAGGGATTSTGGGFSLSGTIGQPVAGLPTGGRFSVQSGFWITPSLLIFAPAKVGNGFNVSFETEPGRTYIVEYTNSLFNPNWQPLPTQNGDGTVKTVSDTAPGVTIRFYRIREQ